MPASLPIVKSISFSGLSDFQHCGHYYKLVNVDKLRQFTKNVWTHWGSLVHKYVQLVLEDKMEPKAASDRFARIWKKFCGLYGKCEYEEGKTISELKDLAHVGALTVYTIKAEFLKKFGNYKVLQVERYIRCPNGSDWPQEFRGFVDIVIQLEDGSVVVIDFKTCKNAWSFNKFKDKFKDYQLTLYKHFLCKEEQSWNPKTTETYFVTLERTPTSKKPVGFTRITSGQKKVDNAIEWLNNTLYAVNNQKWLKNRSSCLKYGEKHPCVFYQTEHCT